MNRRSFIKTRLIVSISAVVSAGAVRGVQDGVNRKLTVTLVPALHKQEANQTITVSRYRSLEFRQWLRASSVNGPFILPFSTIHKRNDDDPFLG